MEDERGRETRDQLHNDDNTAATYIYIYEYKIMIYIYIYVNRHNYIAHGSGNTRPPKRYWKSLLSPTEIYGSGFPRF